MKKDIKGKVVVITGGAGLLGREFAKAIAANAGIPVIADIDGKAAKKVAAGIEGKVDHAELDITSKDSISRLIAMVTSRHKRIDALINSAYPKNPNFGRRLEKVTYEDFCENLNLHLGGYFLVSKKFAEFFKSPGHGNIINLASIYGFMPPRFEVYKGTKMTMPVEYAAIKAGVLQLTRYFAQYYKRYNIRVNAISPGGILDRQPINFIINYKKYCGSKGMLERADLNGTMLFLLSDASKHINGQNIVVDDGFSL